MRRTGFKRKPAKRRVRKLLEQKTAAQLIKPTDLAFSRYIRLRDTIRIGTEFVGTCITCPRRLVVLHEDSDGVYRWVASSQNGHFIGRGVYSLRFDEENCNLQCARCNAWLEKNEMLKRYKKALDDKYGNGTAHKLEALSEASDAYKRPTKPELLQIIKESNSQVILMLEAK